MSKIVKIVSFKDIDLNRKDFRREIFNNTWEIFKNTCHFGCAYHAPLRISSRISLHDMRIHCMIWRISSRISLHIILKTQNIDVRISYWKHRTLTDNSELKQSKYRISNNWHHQHKKVFFPWTHLFHYIVHQGKSSLMWTQSLYIIIFPASLTPARWPCRCFLLWKDPEKPVPYFSKPLVTCSLYLNFPCKEKIISTLFPGVYFSDSSGLNTGYSVNWHLKHLWDFYLFVSF